MRACESCFFAGPKFNYDDRQCRRHAPAVEKVESWKDLREHVPVWPIVKPKDWCGDYVSNEDGCK